MQHFVLPASVDVFLPLGSVLLLMGECGGELRPALQSWEDSAYSHYFGFWSSH